MNKLIFFAFLSIFSVSSYSDKTNTEEVYTHEGVFIADLKDDPVIMKKVASAFYKRK